MTETIEVTSQAPLLNADNANISSDISARQVVELPLNLRNVISLAELNSSVSNTAEEQVVGAPGISGSADQDISFLNFGGTFFDTADYLLDGTYDTRVDWGGVIYVPSVDDVQEFKIQTNAFTSQYGWSSGNVMNVVTKSGTNGFHGDAWEFYRNSAGCALFLQQRTQPAFHRNQYGATIGGPIRKNKTYFFAYYEGLKQATPATFVGTMPTTAERTGDFSALLGLLRARLMPGQTDPERGNLQSVQHATDHGGDGGPDNWLGCHADRLSFEIHSPGNIIPPRVDGQDRVEHRQRNLLADADDQRVDQ